MFAAIISIKYFTNKTTFSFFIDKILSLIDEYSDIIENITKEEMLESMNLPKNFEIIKDL